MNYQISELKNGLRLINTFIPHSKSVTITILVKSGSRQDPTEKLGIAHFLEHMLFKGGGDLKTSMEVAMAIELLGGQSNAYTSYEYTGYYIKVPVEQFSKSIEILVKLISSPIFEEHELEKERGVIIEEIKGYQDIPIEKAKDASNYNLFNGDNLGEDIAGKIETVESITSDDIRNFYRSNYLANNMVISIAGAINHDIANDSVQHLLSNIPSGDLVIPKEFVQGNQPAESRTINYATEQAHLVMGGYSMARNSELKYAQRVGTCILSYGFGARFFQALREQLGIAYYVNMSYAEFNEVGKYYVSAGFDKNRIKEAVKALHKLMDECVEGKLDAEEILRAKNYYKGLLVNEFETSEDISGWVGLQLLMDRDVITVAEYIEKIDQVTEEQVKEYWSKVLTEDNRFVTIVGPFEREILN